MGTWEGLILTDEAVEHVASEEGVEVMHEVGGDSREAELPLPQHGPASRGQLQQAGQEGERAVRCRRLLIVRDCLQPLLITCTDSATIVDAKLMQLFLGRTESRMRFRFFSGARHTDSMSFTGCVASFKAEHDARSRCGPGLKVMIAHCCAKNCCTVFRLRRHLGLQCAGMLTATHGTDR